MPIFRLSIRVFAGLVVAMALVAPCTVSAAQESRLEAVKARGYVNCGVSDSAPGFSQVNAQGRWSGLDVEFCSALAAAVFGNKDAVKFRNLTVGDRFKALQDGEVDVLTRATAWTLTRDTELGARFARLESTSREFQIQPGVAVPRTTQAGQRTPRQ